MTSGIAKSVEKISKTELGALTSELAKATAVLGIVIGALQVASGGFQTCKSLYQSSQIEKAKGSQKKIIQNVADGLEQIKAQLPDLLMTAEPDEILKVEEKMQELRDTLEQLQELEIKFNPAMAAAKKINRRRMEDGIMKTAGGAVGIVSSALTLSGVGAPIGIPFSVVTGILTIGYAVLNYKRNRKANSLTDIAEYLDDEGKPKARPDSKPDYRIMEERIYKCYYNHLSNVLKGTKPNGMKKSEFTKVKEFAWEDKKDRVKSQEKVIVTNLSAAEQLDKTTKKDNWIEVQASGEVIYKEKPKGLEEVCYQLSASAHKSKQSLNASKETLADTLTLLCMHSYNNETKEFTNARIEAKDKADAEALAEYGTLTLNTLLSAADITPKRWTRWFDETSGDSEKLREKVLKHIK
ncbi:MAG: hypothetical protein V7K21_30435 [Nostoc sp.]|uniref:hypothetical protein n=1 Tax=Nostoc sp. TaxID=1180 RepID=UPI002FF731F3